MNAKWIVTCCLAWLAMTATGPGFAQSKSDQALLDMQEAFQHGDSKKVAALLPQVQGHPLEGQAAYWDLKLRLETADESEIRGFLSRYQGQYLEDRLRNDWLLLLGKQKNWKAFSREYALYRMRDDREVTCYAMQVDMQQGVIKPEQARPVVLRNWYAQKDVDDGCDGAVRVLYRSGQISDEDLWRKARVAMEAGRLSSVYAAVSIVSPTIAKTVEGFQKQPVRYLRKYGVRRGGLQSELTALAIIRLDASDVEAAVEQAQRVVLSPSGRSWVWAVIGRSAHARVWPEALDYFRLARNEHLNDDLLEAKARVLLREKQWMGLRQTIEAMSADRQSDSTWVYWRARSLLAAGGAENIAQARTLLESIASVRGFYEMLAMEELDIPIEPPTLPTPLTDAEKAMARQNPGLRRAVYAIEMGLRREGVREWNYTTNLHQSGGMAERELLAAADLACERQIWDRCINTSERTRAAFDWRQRFPMPLKELVVQRSTEIGLDPSYVYGLIRQESRFIMDARSHVGASGLMQVMPATARWTAKKIGLVNYSREMIYDRDINVQIGAGYLKLVLDDFEGSMPLAAAAYNAGPSRSRRWRNGPVLEGAVWAEGIPFSETRDYVKKVLSNTTLYASLLNGRPQSLKQRLGQVTPRDINAPTEDRDLP